MMRSSSSVRPTERPTTRSVSSSAILGTSGTANLPKTSDVDEGDEDEEQGSDDENDLLVRFGSLGKQLKTFQRDLTRADKKVESAKKVSSPLREKRKKRH